MGAITEFSAIGTVTAVGAVGAISEFSAVDAITESSAVDAITESSAMGAIAALKAIHCTCAISYEDETLVIDAIKWACALNTIRPQLPELRLMRSVRPKILKVKK
jgi:hypothetical protein